MDNVQNGYSYSYINIPSSQTYRPYYATIAYRELREYGVNLKDRHRHLRKGDSHAEESPFYRLLPVACFKYSLTWRC
jgi:hypothetical protein